ncbi:MAG: hypothetical protein HC905_02470 [Bacteroidales bacterium]|nr:hypothetical protein [Bacteroidales bacterium]
MIRVIILFFFIYLISCKPVAERDQYVHANAAVPPHIIQVDELMDTLLADGFDFPVGNPDGKGAYVSKTDGKFINPGI